MQRLTPRLVGILALATASFTSLTGCDGCTERGQRPQAETEHRPNVVLIIIDLLRADLLGSYGSTAGASPELDAYAAKGVRFERVVAQNTWTRPSHGSMFTSRHPRTLGLYEASYDMLPKRFDTLAEMLKRAGYTTLGATANPNINSLYNFQQGFDVYADSDIGRRDGEAPRRVDAEGFHSADVVFQRLLDAVSTRKPSFYLQANLMEVHEAGRLRKKGITSDSDFRKSPRGNRRHLAALRHVSAMIGTFIDELSARRGWENTLFIITSDHGETFGVEHGHIGLPEANGQVGLGSRGEEFLSEFVKDPCISRRGGKCIVSRDTLEKYPEAVRFVRDGTRGHSISSTRVKRWCPGSCTTPAVVYRRDGS